MMATVMTRGRLGGTARGLKSLNRATVSKRGRPGSTARDQKKLTGLRLSLGGTYWRNGTWSEEVSNCWGLSLVSLTEDVPAVGRYLQHVTRIGLRGWSL